ncbi:hypothetical protein [Rhodococcus sp. MTM3W5.2]|uniref:hypothetical protein n=1 Tax=Rhodococcus sp. MTM3W5.2 TaxID=1805827 RepID=UPI00097C12C1|nr:hypothetical protein [Rhodococcus sp. MTM3W5.2]
MLRNLTRRGASLLVAGALLGGGLALGGGAASAEEAPGDASGSAEPFMITVGCNAVQSETPCEVQMANQFVKALLRGLGS